MKARILAQPVGRSVVRTPAFPWVAFASLVGEDEVQMREALAAGRDWMRTQLADPRVKEALFVASPSLVGAMAAWEQDPGSKRGRRFEQAAMRYLTRMTTRCTPFGLFSGVGSGAVSMDTEGGWQMRAGGRVRRTRIDMGSLCKMCAAMLKDPIVRHRTHFRVNESMWKVGDLWCYYRPDMSVAEAKDVRYHLSSADASEVLDALVAEKHDPLLFGGMVAYVAEKVSAAPEEAAEVEAFVEEMVEAHVLLPSLWPNVHSGAPLDDILAQVRAMGESPWLVALEEMVAILDALDEAHEDFPQASYLRLVEIAKEVFGVTSTVDKLVQVDMALAVEHEIGAGALMTQVDEALRLFEVMARLRPSPKGAPGGKLGKFGEAFGKRYETRDVPMLEALDEEHGIGWEALDGGAPKRSSLLEAVKPLRGRGEGVGESTLSVNPLDKKLFEIALAAHGEKRRVVTVSEELFRPSSSKKVEVGEPRAWRKDGLLNVEATAEGFLLEYLAQMSQIRNLLGRFCHLDEGLAAVFSGSFGRELEEWRESGVLLAEIAHFPGGRIGNVLARPNTFEAAISFFGVSEPGKTLLRPKDLYIRQVGSGLHLVTREGQRVLPVNSNAHNLSHPANLGVYAFMGSMWQDALRQSMVGTGVSDWDWGALAEQLPWRPRVVTKGGLILAAAEWVVDTGETTGPEDASAPAAPQEDADEFADDADGKDDGRKADILTVFRKWRGIAAKHDLPRYVWHAAGDNKILVDFESPLSVDAFASTVRGRPKVKLSEALLPSPAVTDEAGNALFNEIKIPVRFVGEAPAKAEEPKVREVRPVEAPERRVLMPGDECVQFNLYASERVLDEILHSRVGPLVRELQGSGVLDRWFFIRYADARGAHLRLRFFPKAQGGAGQVLEATTRHLSGLVTAGILSLVTAETYRPEVERYQRPWIRMDEAERIFCADSEMALKFAALVPIEERWKATMETIRGYLEMAFPGQPEAQRAFAEQRADEYLNEFGLKSSASRSGVGDFFRKHRKAFLGDPEPLVATVREMLAELFGSDAMTPLRVRAASAEGMEEDLLGSLIHMAANRMSASHQRLEEGHVYAQLARVMDAQRHMAKRAVPVEAGKVEA